ncbi:MAG TPA: GNAT family N-acetyltransferase, partial [Solirubrobacter sp.]|nr:GNAT family N-acetyltransferase [Solirubrobacter sp.]
LGCHDEYLVATDDGDVRGVLPLMWTGDDDARVYNSLPFYGSHGSVLAADPQAEAALIAAYDERATAGETLAATMVANPFADRQPPEPAHNLTDERISLVTELPGDEEALLALIEPSARRNVRKAQRSGIVATTDAARLPAVAEIHRDNIQALGGRAKELSFFEAVPEHFEAGHDFDVYVALLDDEVVAGLLVFFFNGTVEYFTPAVHHDHRSRQPLALLLVAAMTAAAQRGYRRWNWGGTWTSQDGVYRFKRKWGAREGRYRYFVQINDESLLDATAPELRERYGDFYVVPFSALRTSGGS